MAHKVISEEELKLLTSVLHQDEKEQPKRPKLTMKFLHELIGELHHENLMLAKRIDELEQQLDKFHQIRDEVAATVELPVLEDPEMTFGMEKDLDTNLPQAIRIPRSERHASQKKKSFWALSFHSRTS